MSFGEYDQKATFGKNALGHAYGFPIAFAPAYWECPQFAYKASQEGYAKQLDLGHIVCDARHLQRSQWNIHPVDVVHCQYHGSAGGNIVDAFNMQPGDEKSDYAHDEPGDAIDQRRFTHSLALVRLR